MKHEKSKLFKSFGVILACATLFFGCSDNTANVNENQYQPLNETFISATNYANTIDLAKNVSPAIVGITSVDSTGESVGSGVCVAKGGYVLTNYHVLANPNNITLHYFNGDSGSASYVWGDSVQDIAIVKSEKSMPYLPLAEVNNIAVGEDVVAVGTPITLTLKHTFTKGIVSALNRTLRVSSLSGESYMQNLIQHDASLNPGNSGGPLVNTNGEVVGINTLKISGGEGIGFAIPVKSIASLLENVVENINYKTPYLGVYGYDSEIAKYYNNTNINNGVYVLDISASSPLNLLGVKKGDVITAINGHKINNILDLRYYLYQLNYGDVANISYVSNGNNVEGEITLSNRVHF